MLALLLLVPLVLHAHHPTATEEAVARLFDSMPHGAHTLFLILYQLAALWAVGLLVVTVLLLRRWRLARDLAVAAAGAWVLGRLMAFLVHDSGLWNAFKVTFDLDDAPRFPMVRLAVAVATVLVASPHLARPTRRFGQALVALLALSCLYLSRALPDRPPRRDRPRMGRGARGGIRVRNPGRGDPRFARSSRRWSRSASTSPTSVWPPNSRSAGPCSAPCPARPARRPGAVRIIALGRDEADAQLLARAWRYLAYRDAPPTLLPSRRAQVEYEAYLVLLARDAGVDAPR